MEVKPTNIPVGAVSFPCYANNRHVCLQVELPD